MAKTKVSDLKLEGSVLVDPAAGRYYGTMIFCTCLDHDLDRWPYLSAW